VKRAGDQQRAIDAFVVALGRAAATGDVIPVVLHHGRELLGADVARLVLDDGADPRAWATTDAGLVAASGDDHDRRLLEEARRAGGVAESTLADGTPCLAGLHADGEETVLLAIGRRRGVDGRTRAQFASVLAHAAVALQNMWLVTRLQEKAHALEHLASHDPLTGLANRARFQQVAEEALARGEVTAAFLIDLDRFKEVNDTLGHHIGDQLLSEIAYRLRFSVGRAGLIARLGGDEFAVLVLDGDVPPRDLAEHLHSALERPVDLGEVEVDVGASIGIAIPATGEGVADLLRHADVAMYDAKSSREGVRVYSEATDHYRPESLALVPRFRSAIEHGDLAVAYQPQFELGTGSIIGAEALVRWSLPGVGPIPPTEFVPIAESTGLIRALTRHVLVEAIESCARWAELGPPLRVSVNIAPRVLLEAGFADGVSNLLRLAGIDPEMLRLEVTETSVMTDPDRAVAVLRDLADRGMSIAIDDFGTGHSSLAYLTSLPCQELKIDRSFIVALDFDPRAVAVVSAIVRLGHDLGLDVVAEGVETTNAAEQLARLGCRLVQGFHFGRPLQGGEFDRFLLGHRTGDGQRVPLG
jgi:diguanylate cyclase (GGDEF)-like protein